MNAKGGVSQMQFTFSNSDIVVLMNFYVSLCSEGEGVKGPKIAVTLKICPLRQLKSSTGISKGKLSDPETIRTTLE